jgi:hypothetical protein
LGLQESICIFALAGFGSTFLAVCAHVTSFRQLVLL